MMIALVIMIGLLAIGAALIAYGTAVKNKWGINLGAVSCPPCKTLFPMVRRPQSLSQAMWGGGTCGMCGTETDKWGREMVPHASNKNERSVSR
jgi:hypothetical protein